MAVPCTVSVLFGAAFAELGLQHERIRRHIPLPGLQTVDDFDGLRVASSRLDRLCDEALRRRDEYGRRAVDVL
jgi:hypothetical protein